MNIPVLDSGFVRFVEDWGRGDAGIAEAGIIEAARQSTQGAFRQWEPYRLCESCGMWTVNGQVIYEPEKTCDALYHNWKLYPKGDEGLLAYLYSNKPPHATPFEFAGCVMEIKAPILVYREWHRHRTFSYNEMSARYAPLPNDNYLPTVDRCIVVPGRNKQANPVAGAQVCTHEFALGWLERSSHLYDLFEDHYQDGLRGGIPKEVARINMPVGRYSQMRASTNLRNWLAFMTLRADPGAQWEIQEFARAVGQILAARFPRTWALYVEGKS